MDIFKGLFSQNESETDESTTQVDSPDISSSSSTKFRHTADEWKYAYDEIDTVLKGDNETLSIGYDQDDTRRNNEEAYAGKWVRQIIASRLANDRHTDDTWLGYSDGALEGLTPEGVNHNSFFKHASIFGKTGYGKSTLLKNMMLQWIMSGYGVCFFDLHGEDSMELLQSIPEHRLDDVVWIEPAGEFDREVGMNFFEPSSERGTNDYEREVKEIEQDFAELIDVQDGKRMKPITQTIVRQLVKAEQNFTPIEFYKILEEEEEKELLAEHFGDSFERPSLRRLQEYDSDELRPIKRRIKDWVEQEHTRRILSRRESTVKIKQAIESNKILIYNVSNLNDEMKSIIASTMVRRIWNAVRKRNTGRNNRPYYLVLDEFHKLEHPKMPIDNILAEARKFKLSLTLCTQHIEQIQTKKFVEEMNNNCETFLSFNPTSGSPSKAKEVAEIVGKNVSHHALMDLPPYQLVGRIYDIERDSSQTVNIRSFAPFPPLRTKEEAKEEIRKSLQKYGAEKRSKGEIDFDDYSLKDHLTESDVQTSSNKKLICKTDNGENIYQSQLLEAIHTAEIRYDTVTAYEKDGWIRHDDLIDELDKYLSDGTGYASVLSNGIEKISDKLLEQGQYSGDSIYRLTAEGQEKVFVQDTGSGGSGGKEDHRRVLSEAYKIFTKLGYNVRLPSQDAEGQLPDGIAEPPIKPSEGENIEEIDELRDELIESYPDVWNLFKDNTVSIESETTTPSRPSQPMTNLSKAIDKGRKCVFVVPDGNILKSDSSDSDKDVEALANRLENIFTDPPCVRSIEDGFKRYYNGSGKMELKDGTAPVYDTRANNGNIVWKRNMDNGQIILTQTKRSSPIARFRNTTELESPSGNKFDYRVREKHGMVEVIRGKDSKVVEEYESKREMKSDWTYISPPELPENHFEDGVPKRDDWKIILLPESNRDVSGPQIYENGTMTSLNDYIQSETIDTSQRTQSKTQPSQDSTHNTSEAPAADSPPEETQPDTAVEADTDPLPYDELHSTEVDVVDNRSTSPSPEHQPNETEDETVAMTLDQVEQTVREKITVEESSRQPDNTTDSDTSSSTDKQPNTQTPNSESNTNSRPDTKTQPSQEQDTSESDEFFDSLIEK